ncbi:hypothetical protein CP533_2402 [Ophiocordyceps camponoti-saundersi (nom. inval.)]|nr:hypothetical protein CP533_2402 [Ophiocordyceps camponoti-saundersi (nom. inval.)]
MPPPCMTVRPTATPTMVDDCRTRTVCIDYVNSCGIMYGTCVADCDPRPVPTPPPCPKTSTLISSVKAKTTP